MYRVSVFTLGTTLSPYSSLHAYTNTRAHAVRSFSFFLPFFFLDPAISRASCASFVLLVPHTRACIYSYARLVSHSRNERSYNNSCSVRPFLFSSLSSFLLHNHHCVKPHSSRPAVAQQPPVANKMLYIGNK